MYTTTQRVAMLGCWELGVGSWKSGLESGTTPCCCWPSHPGQNEANLEGCWLHGTPSWLWPRACQNKITSLARKHDKTSEFQQINVNFNCIHLDRAQVYEKHSQAAGNMHTEEKNKHGIKSG